MESREKRLDTQNRLLRLVPEVRWRLREVSGLTGVGVGAKEVGGEVTDEFAFRVYVDRKLAVDELPSNTRIPDRIKGVATDVLVKSSSKELVDTSKHRPLIGGAQVKNQYVEGDDTHLAGTIGCLVQMDNVTADIMALTCEHVILAGQATTGVLAGQPEYWVSCCCCVHGQIGPVFSAVNNDQVDCALIRLDDDIVEQINSGGTLNQVSGLGPLTGVAQAVCFEQVRKRGRTTETTAGQIVDVMYETSQILIHPTAPATFAASGDSGSVVINSSDQVVGLLWATDAVTKTRGVANHIGEVMRELGIVIAGQDATGLPLPTTACSSSGP